MATREQIQSWLHATQDGRDVTLSHADSVEVFMLALGVAEAADETIATLTRERDEALRELAERPKISRVDAAAFVRVADISTGAWAVDDVVAALREHARGGR